jgi:hypothetical protein
MLSDIAETAEGQTRKGSRAGKCAKFFAPPLIPEWLRGSVHVQIGIGVIGGTANRKLLDSDQADIWSKVPLFMSAICGAIFKLFRDKNWARIKRG